MSQPPGRMSVANRVHAVHNAVGMTGDIVDHVMHRHVCGGCTLSLVSILTLLVSVSSSGADKKGGLSSATLAGLKFRSIGPALMSGRIADFAVHPEISSTYYVAVASGGVWRTINAGTTYEPVFDREGSFSIGCITLDPSNPSVVWVGTGESNSQRSVSYGDGVCKSEDGGKSWKNMGLKSSEHISRIIVHPHSSNIIHVAAQGPLWSAGGDRGVFTSTDGGATWRNTLSISKHTGVNELIMDPRDPAVMYAAAYQRRRHVWTLIDGGPESAIYKTTTGGESWNKLTNGLPGGDLGRIGLALAPTEPDIVYALIELPSREGGFYRSTDRGASWEKRSSYISNPPMYYGRIVADPFDPDRVYAMDVSMQVTNDGGLTFDDLGMKSRHGDDHAIWIDPRNRDHYLLGTDGGIYESFDRGATWGYKPNLPVTQFYRVSVDNARPFYNVYGGTQDNFSVGGPSRTMNITGITNADWFVTRGGDGFETVVDPHDPSIVYSQLQHGGLVRYDRRSGEMIGIKPQEKEGKEPYRWNWDSPLVISPHLHTRLYFAANILFRSEDRGNSWTPVSGDLTRRIDRNTLPVMDKVWGADAVAKHQSTSFYGNCTALSESPLKEGLLYVGTDDGLVQVSMNGGSNWRKIEKFGGVPSMTFVSRLEASLHDTLAVYAAFDNHKNGDYKPYVLKSTDAGNSWMSIAGNLPVNGSVYAIAEDHNNPALVFVGTEFGVYCTVDGGREWVQLKGGIPTIAVRDIDIQRRENDLVLATFGRGFYILDDYTPLREIARDALQAKSYLFPIKDVPLYQEARPLGGRGKVTQGEAFFTAPNPPFGVVITYHLQDGLKTLKERRQEKEKELEKNGHSPPVPTLEELRRESSEESPRVVVTVSNDKGEVVRRLHGPTTAGIHRLSWNMRRASLRPSDSFSGHDGSLAPPGTYSVSIEAYENDARSKIREQRSFVASSIMNTTLPAPDRTALAEFLRKVERLQGSIHGGIRHLREVESSLGRMEKALGAVSTPASSLEDDCRRARRTLDDLEVNLVGDGQRRRRNENDPPSIEERVDDILDDLWLSTSTQTQTHERSYEIAGTEFEKVLARLREVTDVEVRRIEAELDRLGAPWTPGRIPDWRRK